MSNVRRHDAERSPKIMIRLHRQPVQNQPRRDFWDKADVIAKFLSSVVIAVIGIAITWSIQQTQIRTNEAIARAQIEAGRAKAADDRRLQESQITVQLTTVRLKVEQVQLVSGVGFTDAGGIGPQGA
jgi:hypothetical protein